jgi:hypothetical protein
MPGRAEGDEAPQSGKCGSKLRHRAGYCGQAAGWNTNHLGIGRCAFHGGLTENHNKAAQTEQARRAVATYGLPRDIDPAKALLEEVARTAGHVDYLAEKVRELEPEALVWSKSKAERITASETPGTNVTIAAQVNVWLELYRAERKHLVDVSKTALAAGIAERQVKLAEQHGHLIADVLRKVLADPELGLTDEQRKAVPAVARRHLSVA